ncbi:hypothetical protein [Ligilactobacillus acidipiscis]|uniref:hypothetical protein n=1 Tax=Ligilactobacillus acidipiscis TaxID=89059 RepID=UPI0023FA09EE|nr:hypothetical protein [Ligilactobacillus acidipiscis]WEV56167.1 hypothetical protein OZX66_07880 [Ligilactobacillus acidipiscis]
MNELNKNDIAQETHAKAIGYYKQSEQFGYKFLMELKKIRDDRLFNELGFNDFEQYTIENFGYSKRSINESIQSALSWGEDYKRISARLGKYKTLQLAQLPEDERDEVLKNGVKTSKGNKSVDDATVKEIKELNRKLKQSEEANKTLDGMLSEKADTISALEQQVKKKPKPEIVEKTVTKEVKPDDYEELKQRSDSYKAMQERNGFLEKQIKGLEERISQLNHKSDEYKELEKDIDDLKKQRSNVRKSIDAGANIMSLNDQLQEMFDTKVSALRYKNFFADDPMTSTVEETEDLLDTLQGFINDMRKILPQHDRKIIEGKFSE